MQDLSCISNSERLGEQIANHFLAYLTDNNARSLRDEDGVLNVIIDGRRIPITSKRDNVALAGLMLKACNVSTLSQAAQAAIQRIQVEIESISKPVVFRRFAAVSADQERVYIPARGNVLVQVGADDFQIVPNGDNQDSLWLEHPEGDPFTFVEIDDPPATLEKFERLLVDTLASPDLSLRWLTAIDLGYFPFIRDLVPARFILEIIGGSQAGKTSAAERYTRLHGLGAVKGDYTVAALANEGDIGLLVADNKEQANFEQPLIDYFLYLARGQNGGVRILTGRCEKEKLADRSVP